MKTDAPEVVVLAGGKGTRLKSVTGPLPKVLVPVAGRPILDWKLEQLAANGVNRAHLLIGYEADLIEEHLAVHSQPLEIEVHRDGPVLLGTGGAIAAQAPLLPSSFVVTYADSLLDEPLQPIWDAFVEGAFPALMAVTQQFDSELAGNVALVDDLVFRYAKDPSDHTLNWLDYGYLAINRKVLAGFRAPEVQFDLGAMVADLAERRQLSAYRVSSAFWEVGTPDSLKAVADHLSAPSN